MDPSEALRLSDPAVVARYLFLRSLFHDRILGQVEQFFELPADRQTAALVDWYHHWLEWLVSNGLLTKK